MKETAFVVLYHVNGERGCDTEVVLIKQRRGSGMSIEIPGGHVNPDEMVRDAAARELHEETGITVASRTLHYVGGAKIRNRSGSLAHVFSRNLSAREFEKVQRIIDKGKPRGADEDEEIFLMKAKIRSIESGDVSVDWITAGMILKAYNLYKAFYQ